MTHGKDVMSKSCYIGDLVQLKSPAYPIYSQKKTAACINGVDFLMR